MYDFAAKKALVIGASRGVGREIAVKLAAAGAVVRAVARGTEGLDLLARDCTSISTLAGDMADADTVARSFVDFKPDILIIAGGATPSSGSFHDLDWSDFSQVWETDTKATFMFLKAAINLPLDPGARVLVISSGAGLGGSPASGGYAGAKRMQMFLANYAQNESDRTGLGIDFASLVIKQIMTETELGRSAAQSYADRGNISVAEFMTRFKPYIKPQDAAEAALRIVAGDDVEKGTCYGISGQGLEVL